MTAEKIMVVLLVLPLQPDERLKNTSLPYHKPARQNHLSKAAEQLGFLGGVFLISQDAATLQGGEFFQAGKDVAVGARSAGR